ncbi:hypothetical protein BTJ40_05275 [Microbulbifer sp. A4B17]|nr:hypothetical protein BTJ40_05275 [Microbulbifer sp. A4B17]
MPAAEDKILLFNYFGVVFFNIQRYMCEISNYFFNKINTLISTKGKFYIEWECVFLSSLVDSGQRSG